MGLNLKEMTNVLFPEIKVTKKDMSKKEYREFVRIAGKRVWIPEKYEAYKKYISRIKLP